MSYNKYLMRQSGSYEMYKASNHSTFPPELNLHSLVVKLKAPMFLNFCFQLLHSRLHASQISLLYINQVFSPLRLCNTHLFASIPLLFIALIFIILINSGPDKMPQPSGNFQVMIFPTRRFHDFYFPQ